MSDQEDLAKKTATNYAVRFGVIGTFGFQIFVRLFFERPPGGGIDYFQVVLAGLVGGLSSLLGYLVGKEVAAGRK